MARIRANDAVQAKLKSNGYRGESVLIEKTFTDNGTYSASTYDADGFDEVTVNVQPSLMVKTITSNGPYKASDYGVQGFSQVNVDLPFEIKDDIIPSTTQQTIVPSQGYEALERVTVAPAPLESKTITPETVQRTYTPTAPNIGFSDVTVEAHEPPAPVEEKDVNFYDYDGSILYSYSKSEFLVLEEFPTAPTHDGLTFQEWNWSTLQAVKDYVTTYGVCDVGAIYTTDDGSTRFYITIKTNQRLTVPLLFTFSSHGSVMVDWGDGTITTETGATSHTYAPSSYPSSYIIKVTLINGTLTWGRNNASIFGSDSMYKNMATKAEIGFGLLGAHAFDTCGSLRSIIVSNNASLINDSAFHYCEGLKAIIIPRSTTNIPQYSFAECHSLTKIVLPNSILRLSKNCFYGCAALKKIILPNSIKTIDNFSLYGLNSLLSIIIPNSVTFIGVLPLSSHVLDLMDLSAFDETIPLLHGVLSIPEPVIIAVKNQTMKDLFSAATNWSNFAAYYVIKDW